MKCNITKNGIFVRKIPSFMLMIAVTIGLVIIGFQNVKAFPIAHSSSTSRISTLEKQQPHHHLYTYHKRPHDDHGITTTTTASTTTRLGLSKNNENNENNDGTSLTSIWNALQEKPGGLIILPFVIIFGLDLLLNIFFLTKRSFEYIVLGQAPSQETWF
jgi:hypothetical protein